MQKVLGTPKPRSKATRSADEQAEILEVTNQWLHSRLVLTH